MRGNKFYIKLCLVIIAILCIGIVGGVYLTPQKISAVQAEDTTKFKNDKCSQKYEDGVVFSVEQVYYSKTGRTAPLYLTAGQPESELTNVLGYDDNANYFLNYGGYGTANEVLNKKIINDGDYAYLQENVTRTVFNESGESVSLNQGIMITLGGYVFDKDGMLHANSETSAESLTGYTYTNSTTSPAVHYYSSQLQSINIEMRRNGSVFTSTDESDESKKASLRTYNKGLYFDFVYFLDYDNVNEGFYEINFSYVKVGGETQTHSFSFYILLSGKYDNSVVVNGQEYYMSPNISNANSKSSTQFYSSVDKEQYPILTYDYKHYDMKYTYVHNDLVSNVVVRYEEIPNQGIDRLVIESKTNGVVTTEYHSCKTFTENDIVSFLFANVGQYEFEFNYVYYYNNTRLVVNNLTIENKVLNVYGYELKYAKTGFASSDLRHLSIVQNGTMIIPVNGYVNSVVTEDKTKDLGYMYEIVAPETVEGGKKKTGDITILQTADVTSVADVDESVAGKIKIKDINALKNNLSKKDFIDTDQGGLWFNLNDLYSLTNCYYLYSATMFKADTEGYTYEPINKATTFTKTGYYFVKVGYAVNSDPLVQIVQYFAFKISSGVANVQIYTTDGIEIPSSNSNRLYSNEFTNKNVYATWDDPTTFASSQSAKLYCTRDGFSNIYESKSSLMKFALGATNNSLIGNAYVKGKTLLTRSGSYLLEVKVNGSDAKAYYYFTIDKEDISGLDVLAVSSASIGNKNIYNVARNEKNEAITYTSRLVIDQMFTFWWDDKRSGAQISGSYTYTPIISAKNEKKEITENNDLWLINDYVLGNTSNKISIQKPATKISTVDPNNVLVNQGIYWFNLIDDAGNTMNYMVVIDNTKSVIQVTIEDGNGIRKNVVSGEMVAENVEVEWGTHKAVTMSTDLGSISANSVLNNISDVNSIKYYTNESSNLNKISNYFKNFDNTTAGKTEMYLVIENKLTTISSKFGNAIINQYQGSLSHPDIDMTNWHNVTIKLNDKEVTYVIEVYGDNQVEQENTPSYFTVVLNPDKSEGAVGSKSDETEKQFRKVDSYNTTFRKANGTDPGNEAEFDKNYNLGQASDDGLFVFEWNNNSGSVYEVGKVSYEYYPLMTQEELDLYSSTNSKYKYYPYDYDSVTSYTIYEKGKVNNYEIDSNGVNNIYRSTVLNAGYVLYYDQKGNLVSKYATLPGMYVITREYLNETTVETNGKITDSKTRKYVFFVDRNNIIDYSTTSVSNKTIGEYIDIYSQEGSVERFSNFTSKASVYEWGTDKYNINLETNRLPMEIRVPTGKYASKVNGVIEKTSNSYSGLLNVKIDFIDEYKLLGNTKILFTLFNSVKASYNDSGYLTYKLSFNDLNPNISNMANIQNYLTACAQTGNDWLSLPGIYIITLTDNVGYVINAQTQMVSDCNIFTIGVKITKSNPEVKVLANQNPDDEVHVAYAYLGNDAEFDTSHAYVRYELLKPDNTSYNAQIDAGYIYIERENINTNEKVTYYESEKDIGIINKTMQFTDESGKSRNYIQDADSKWIVWLDTGLVLDNNGQIVDYQEYKYTIKIRYILKNGQSNYTNCYIYNKLENNVRKDLIQSYESVITVNIDRTPYLSNLENSVENQITYFEEYVEYYSEEGFVSAGKLDSKIYNTRAYRDLTTQEDYYAVVNQLYYYYIDQGEYEKAENSMYAIRVGKDDSVTLKGSMYYRKLYTSPNSQDRRLALLPVCAQFSSNLNGFITFNNNSYTGFNSVQTGLKNWGRCLNITQNGYGYYEIIEVDSAGNMNQYIVYVPSYDGNVEQEKEVNFTFEDTTGEYKVKFNFANTPRYEVVLGSETVGDTFSLIPFIGVQDMFGLECNVNDGNTGSTNKDNKDWFYKVNIVNNYDAVNESFYLNYNNDSLAEYIYDVFVKDVGGKLEIQNGNYTFTITDRYSNSLSIYINILTEGLTLNTDAVQSEFNGTYWYIEPSKLNTKITESGAMFYARKLELKDLTSPDEPVITFYLKNDGSVEKIESSFEPTTSNNTVLEMDNGIIKSVTFGVTAGSTGVKTEVGYARIGLVTGNDYEVRLVDCANADYGPFKVYAYANADNDVSINAWGVYSISNNVYYSANPIEISYNKNIYTNITIDVIKDGTFLGRFYGGFSIDDGLIVVEETTSGKIITLRFNPYKAIADTKETGAKLEFEIKFIYDNKDEKPTNIVLDNRMSLINLINTAGEDKTNIIRTEYINYTSYNNIKTLSVETLFSYAPTLTLSETVILDWSNYDDTIYANNLSSYYNSYLYLVEFREKTNWIVTELGEKGNPIMNISPKEGCLGRYVLIYAFYKDSINLPVGENVELVNTNLICYKAFVFNISSTANAMYEVQDSNGEVVDYLTTIGGDLLYNALLDAQKLDLNSKFNLSTDSGNSDKYENYIYFTSSTIPLYITTDIGYRVVTNGDNGISAEGASYRIGVSSDYTIFIYKVYSSVYTTFVAILQVVDRDDFIQLNADNDGNHSLRYVSNTGNLAPTSLYSITNIMLNSFGKMYFINFNYGNLADEELNQLVLAKYNKVYLEVWYKYNENDDGAVKVGSFYGENYEGRDNTNFIEFNTSGTYLIYLKDSAGNVRRWFDGTTSKNYLTLTVIPEVIVAVNNDIPVDYNYYNSEVMVSVLFTGSGYYDNGSISMSAYFNGNTSEEYISKQGNKNNVTSYTFKEYGTYTVIIKAKIKGADIQKTVKFSIINPNEARLALDFTQIDKYNITKVINSTTKADVTTIFRDILNEGYIYNKLVTYDRLSRENAFGSTMGKQTFTVYYSVNNDSLIPTRECSFEFTVNNQTPSLRCSVAPGETTTKNITIEFNAQTIYRQVGDCYITVNGNKIVPISYDKAYDGTTIVTLKEVGDYYVAIETDSGRVITSFKVTIKEPLNTMSIILIVVAILVVVGLVTTFIILRTRMKVR